MWRCDGVEAHQERSALLSCCSVGHLAACACSGPLPCFGEWEQLAGDVNCAISVTSVVVVLKFTGQAWGAGCVVGKLIKQFGLPVCRKVHDEERRPFGIVLKEFTSFVKLEMMFT